MGRPRRRYEDTEEMVAREAGRSPRFGGAALVAVALVIACAVLRALV